VSTRLRHDLTYDAPADAVTAMLADKAFREEVCDFIGVTRKSVVIEAVGDGMHVTIDQWQPTGRVQSFAKKFVGEEVNIVQREIWTTPLLGDISIAIPGKPGDMNGTVRISEAHGVTTESIDLSVKVGIPLIGGKVEDYIAALLLKALKAENKVGRDYLAR
jgi:hypothetical protein